MQPSHAAKLIGALLNVVGRNDDALLLRRVHRQLVAHYLLDQAFELASQFEKPDELAHIHDFIVNSHYCGHVVRSFG
jgi:hypothetical protein